MIRPCDECGGSGNANPEPLSSAWIDCPRCGEMPRLVRKAELGWFGRDTRDWFYPDPDTVMDYCPVHEGFFHWTNAEESFGPRCDVYRIRNGAPEDKCVRVWVARPTPLEVVEE